MTGLTAEIPDTPAARLATLVRGFHVYLVSPAGVLTATKIKSASGGVFTTATRAFDKATGHELALAENEPGAVVSPGGRVRPAGRGAYRPVPAAAAYRLVVPDRLTAELYAAQVAATQQGAARLAAPAPRPEMAHAG